MYHLRFLISFSKFVDFFFENIFHVYLYIFRYFLSLSQLFDLFKKILSHHLLLRLFLNIVYKDYFLFFSNMNFELLIFMKLGATILSSQTDKYSYSHPLVLSSSRLRRLQCYPQSHFLEFTSNSCLKSSKSYLFNIFQFRKTTRQIFYPENPGITKHLKFFLNL